MYLCAMFQKISHISIVFIVFGIVLSSCSDYQKALKSSDYDLKYEKAMEYYNDGDYLRALNLFDELLTIYKGTDRAEKIYYYYADCHYQQKDYILAGHYFRSFARTFPRSELAEEAEYLSAYCFYKDSPSFSLDQDYTMKAIEEMQYFINKHAGSDKIKEANEIIDALYAKLEQKSFEGARLYHKLGNYKAAIVALKNSLIDYPDSKYREQILYLIFESSYLLAENSIESKKDERFIAANKAYMELINEYPRGEFLSDANKLKKKIDFYMKDKHLL